MGKCVNHPDRDTDFICMKHNVHMCDECVSCRDPEIYCKFRSSCPIWFMHKEKKREARQREAQAAIKTLMSCGIHFRSFFAAHRYSRLSQREVGA